MSCYRPHLDKPNEDESRLSCDGPSPKRRKLNHTRRPIISSKLFCSFDQDQFRRIFKSIEKSAYIRQLDVSKVISKEIAEYATGQIKDCANTECEQTIIILNQDLAEYNNDHSNSQKLNFKYCFITESFYCLQCMHLAQTANFCNCDDVLYFPSNKNQCMHCKEFINFGGPGRCPCNHGWSQKCSECELELISCNYCSVPEQWSECVGDDCGKKVCAKCSEDCLISFGKNCVCKVCEAKTNRKCQGGCGTDINLLYHGAVLFNPSFSDVDVRDGQTVCHGVCSKVM